jgi:hypothetical protein
VTAESCPLYRLANKSWQSVPGSELPVGTKVLGQAPPARADIVYARTFDATYIVSRRCLKESDDGGSSGLPAAPSSSSDEAVDLSDVNATSAATGSSMAETHGGANGGTAPNFKVYFDFNVVNRPGQDNFDFENYHSFLLFEIAPTPDITFSFDIEPVPKYYELAYQVTKKLQFRVGKIFIPFDDLTPHNIYGGRINTSRLEVTGQDNPFLPDLWTDLGGAVRYQFLDTTRIALEGDIYVVNGFGEGGTDPTGQSPIYPNFADVAVTNPDNNREKAYGGRLHTILYNTFGIGLSYYRDRWSSDNHDPEFITIYGADSQIRFNRYELRAGVIQMNVNLPTGDFTRGGFYAELGRLLGNKDQYKVLARGGKIQFDSRVADATTDQTIIGGMLIYKPNVIQYAVEYSRDIQKNANKFTYGYFDASIIVAL